MTASCATRGSGAGPVRRGEAAGSWGEGGASLRGVAVGCVPPADAADAAAGCGDWRGRIFPPPHTRVGDTLPLRTGAAASRAAGSVLARPRADMGVAVSPAVALAAAAAAAGRLGTLHFPCSACFSASSTSVHQRCNMTRLRQAASIHAGQCKSSRDISGQTLGHHKSLALSHVSWWACCEF